MDDEYPYRSIATFDFKYDPENPDEKPLVKDSYYIITGDLVDLADPEESIEYGPGDWLVGYPEGDEQAGGHYVGNRLKRVEGVVVSEGVLQPLLDEMVDREEEEEKEDVGDDDEESIDPTDPADSGMFISTAPDSASLQSSPDNFSSPHAEQVLKPILNDTTEENAATALEAAYRGHASRKASPPKKSNPKSINSSPQSNNGNKPFSGNKSKRALVASPAVAAQLEVVSLPTAASPATKLTLSAPQLASLAQVIDGRLRKEFGEREEALKAMQEMMGKMRMQLTVLGNEMKGKGSKGKTDQAAAAGIEDGGASPEDITKLSRRKSVQERFNSYSFDPQLPRVAQITKKAPGELNEIDVHRIAAANSVVRYAESRSAVYEPTGYEPLGDRNTAPSGELTLEHVHGYSGKVAKSTNCLYLYSGEVVFPASAAVVIMNTRTNTQRFFLEHDDDVTAVAVHPTLDIVASGQLCRKAFVLLYDVTSTNDEGISFINELNLGNNTRGVKCLDFSPDGAQLLSVAADPYHTVTIWDWKRGIKLVSARANNAEVFSMRFNPFQCYDRNSVGHGDVEYTLVSLGSRHVKFWTLEPDDGVVAGEANVKEAKALAERLGKWKIDANAASFGNRAKIQDIMCVAFVQDEAANIGEGVGVKARVLCGTESGAVFVFQIIEESPAEDPDEFMNVKVDEEEDDKVVKPVNWASRGALLNVVKDAHAGPVFDVAVAAGSKIVATVGKDGYLKLWRLTASDEGDELLAIKSVNIAGVGPMMGAPKSISFSRSLDKVVIGTYGNSLVEVGLTGCDNGGEGEIAVTDVQVIIKGHAGNVKQIAAHPTLPIYASVGDDKSFLLWSSTTNTLLCAARMKEMVYSVAFSPDGENFAVGLVTGDVLVKKLPKNVMEGGKEFVNIGTKRTGNKDKKEAGGAWAKRGDRRGGEGGGGGGGGGGAKRGKGERKDIKHSVTKLQYSPDGKTLIAACRDYFLYVFDVQAGYKKVAVMKGHSTFVTHVDFSKDSRVLQSNDAAREILYWDVELGKQIPNSFDLRDTEWATWTCVYGWSVQGIWDKHEGEQNILSVARSNGGAGCVVTGDDKNMINLFRYPALQGAQNKAFGGHMSPVTSLVWSSDDKKLLSTGGTDCCVFQWDYE